MLLLGNFNDATKRERIQSRLELGVSVLETITDGLIGCPHEEGIDYPKGISCPQCLYRDRFTQERIH